MDVADVFDRNACFDGERIVVGNDVENILAGLDHGALRENVEADDLPAIGRGDIHPPE